MIALHTHQFNIACESWANVDRLLAVPDANEDAAALIEMVLKKVDSRKKELKGYAKFP